MMRWVLYAAITVTLGAGAWALAQRLQPDATDLRLARLRQLQVPPAGAARFAFLKQEVPDVVGQVTCSCCANRLLACYNGACPVSCGPCNEQGKEAYDMYAHGKGIEEIQAYMARHHHVAPGARSMAR